MSNLERRTKKGGKKKSILHWVKEWLDEHQEDILVRSIRVSFNLAFSRTNGRVYVLCETNKVITSGAYIGRELKSFIRNTVWGVNQIYNLHFNMWCFDRPPESY